MTTNNIKLSTHDWMYNNDIAFPPRHISNLDYAPISKTIYTNYTIFNNKMSNPNSQYLKEIFSDYGFYCDKIVTLTNQYL